MLKGMQCCLLQWYPGVACWFRGAGIRFEGECIALKLLLMHAAMLNACSAGAALRRPSATGVLLQGLHISGCKNSAIRVSGGLQPVGTQQWAALPSGLHLVDSSLTGNAGNLGGALRVSRAAVYLDAVEVSSNQASELGGGVIVDQGVLVASRSIFTANTAGSGMM